MALDVDAPDPPELQDVDPNDYDDAEVIGETDYKRDEIAALLNDGAWVQAWDTWAVESDLSALELEIVEDLNLIQHYDFFWDSFADRVGYHAPGIPEDWKERDYHSDLDSWKTVSSINAELTELGQTVCEVLKTDYIEWESEYEPPDDLPDF